MFTENYKLKIEPTLGETLLIGRRRDGLTQAEAAAKADVCPDTWGNWEKDRYPVIGGPQRRLIGELRDYERYFLLRRRADLSQTELAKKLGVTKAWVVKMEKGLVDCSRLRDYWDR